MAFKDKLNDVLCSAGITQSQLSGLTGIGRSSISQYCSGKNIPTEQRQREIALVLGLEENYFQQEDVAAIKQSGKVARLTPEEVADLLGMSKSTIRAGLRDGVFPWGYAIHGSGGKWVYFINAKRFAEIEGITV